MGKKKPVARDEDGGVVGSKSKKKGLAIDDDEYSIGTEISEDQEKNTGKEEQDEAEVVISFTGKKKSKKGTKGTVANGEAKEKPELGEEFEQENKASVEEEDDVPAIVFSGKKKSKSKKSSNSNSAFSASSFGAVLMEEENEGGEPEHVISVNGGKGADGEEEGDVKKQKKKKKKTGKFSLEDDDDGDSEFAINSFTAADVVDEDGFDKREPEPEIEQPVKKGVDSEANKQGNGEVRDTSKKQKKKKKGGRTAQEEDDLDKILAELGEGPAAAKSDAPVVVEEKNVSEEPVVDLAAEPNADGGDAETEGVESAAAKKKKKKKEKEKEKKAAAAAAAVDVKSVVEVKEEKPAVELKSKAPDKKIPKKVREMQEALARLKEAEERKKREEEEKLRKEEEERLRIEELERQREEAKRRKKEKDKEKLLKKKQEGKLLTGKQKEEARRLELMRNQFLAQGVLPVETGGVTKRPKYQTKKKAKPGPAQMNGVDSVEKGDVIEEHNEENVAEVDQSELEEKVEEESTLGETEDKMEGEQELEEDTEEDEDEWDAKSWDDADLALPVKSAFEEEDADPVVKKGTKRVVAPTSASTSVAVKPSSGKNSVASEILTHTPPPAAQAKPAVAAGKISHASGKREYVESKDSESEDEEDTDIKRKKEAAMKREARKADALSKRSADNLRSPICCILGHVDTGKTKLLDCIRGTSVQEGEAGGITQQIGATYFPAENIRERTKELKADAKLRVPGLLVIDTPGHESFTNLRSRGSGLCDIAILVVDIMHGLEPQTIESLNLLKMRNTEFIIALNKVDRLYGWKACPNAPIVKSLKQQSDDVRNEFNMRLNGVNGIIVQLKEQGLNSELYYKNKEMGETVSIVPTSAISGEGIPDLLLLLVQWTQRTMEQKLMFVNEVQCTVLEVKVIEGLGTTIDVVLVNGVLHEGDQIVVCGVQGAITTNIRALLTPHPMKELRVKGSYLHHKELKAAQGIKISAQGLEHAIAGTGLYVVGPEDDVEYVKDTAMRDVENVMSKIDKRGEGVCVQASTLGSLEALLEFLKTPAVNIPVSGISIGPVHKKDVMKANVMNERKMKEYAVILAFDVKVMPEARELADEYGVKIFMADIIYHLFDQFKAYIDNHKEEKKKDAAEEAVFPCVLKIIPNCIFNKKDPIVLGVDVLEGIAKVGTPICIPSRDFIDIGRIASIEINHKQVDVAKKGNTVAIKIVSSNPEEAQKMFGRHFEIEDELVSHISRKSIDVLKTNYREDLTNDEWRLVVKLKNLFKIQ